jgi:hypothetical protein
MGIILLNISQQGLRFYDGRASLPRERDPVIAHKHFVLID